MFFSLKNDVIGIEYPIQHFMSESLRNGHFPSWFNTWGMGFPLQSVLSWGVFSTTQMLTAVLFNSSVYVLHLEFICFIFLSGCAMYKLLKTHFIDDKNLSLLFACCYMLSGFTVGSSQWLLYLTGMTFIPAGIYFLLQLLKHPSLKYSTLFAVSCFLLITNVHVYFTVISFYMLFVFLIIWFAKLFSSRKYNRHDKIKICRYVFLASLFGLVLCAAPAYYSYEVITYLARSKPINNNIAFFQSNYFTPDGLLSLFLPLSSVKTLYPNTEGSILTTYIGLLPLLLAPASFFINRKEKNIAAVSLLIGALFFLVLSFGHLLPLRNWLNVLPGMSNFRHPGVLRIFFILFLILYFASSFKKYRLSDLMRKGSLKKVIVITSIFLFLLFFILTITNATYLSSVWKGSIYETFKRINNKELLAFSALLQFIFISLLFISIYKEFRFFSFLIITELVINTLICTPFFTVSTYSAKEANAILSSPKGFPVQKILPANVTASFIDGKNNVWVNINTYNKQVSTQISMPGPLILNKVSMFLEEDSGRLRLKGKQIAFINGPVKQKDSIFIEEQKPDVIKLKVSVSSSQEIIVQQARFPGWNGYYNNKKINLSANDLPFISAMVPAGEGTLIFRFEKPGVFYSALILHLIVLITVLITLTKSIFKSFSLS